MPQPLSPQDQERLIALIKAGQPLPKEDLYKLAPDEEDVFLFWNGRSEEVTRAVLPFHHIEHIDEPRRETKAEGSNFSMFDVKGRQRSGWHNKLIWGDNKLILSSLAHGPLRQQIEAEGGLKLVYIDPPFAVGAEKDARAFVTVTLEDFVTNYTQDDLETVEADLKKGKSAVVMDGGQIIKVSMDKRGIQDREILTKSWHDWIDYWSVDFDYDSKKELIRVQGDDGSVEEQWTGNYVFENEWQSFRTRQDRSLEFTTSERAYLAPGTYRIMVKVVDILGVDTSQLLEVVVK
jgi:hypothetical protein